VGRFIDPGGNGEARIPFPPLYVPRFVKIDVNIDPFPQRRNLKFLVTPNVIEVGANKGLYHIPVPKFIGFGRCIRIEFQIEFAAAPVLYRLKRGLELE
jgi:hypothetical protein